MSEDRTYKITQVIGEPREWSSQHGPMVSYKIALDGLEGVHELSQKPSTPAPRVGDDLFGHTEQGSYGLRFKKGAKGGGFQGGRGDSPEQRRSIERQVSAKIAADLIIADKASLDGFAKLTERVHAAIRGDA